MKARHKNWSLLAAVVLVAPIAVGVPGSDSTYNTTITLGAGAGRHGTGLDVYLGRTGGSGYGCDSPPSPTTEVRRPVDLKERFTDVGGGIDHKMGSSRHHFGIRGGYVWEQANLVGQAPINPFTDQPVDVSEVTDMFAKTSYWYFNPYWSMEGEHMGVGFGIIRSELPLRTDVATRVPEDLDASASTKSSFHFRVGPRDKFYVSYSLWEGIPIYSGGGMQNAGVGFGLGRHLDMWTSYAFGGPYQSGAVYTRATLAASSRVAVNLSLRVPVKHRVEGADESINETSGSVGLQFRW